MTFKEKVAQARARQKKALKKAAICAALAAAGLLACGWKWGLCFYQGDQVLIEDTYTVQKGDTLRSISEAFLQKNTGSRRYILEFEQGIIELNPILQGKAGTTIHPGDKLRINYWVTKEAADE